MQVQHNLYEVSQTSQKDHIIPTNKHEETITIIDVQVMLSMAKHSENAWITSTQTKNLTTFPT